MKILSAEAIRALDAYTIANEPIASIDLTERASRAFSDWFSNKFDTKKPVYVFCGPGNNGSDGLAIARILSGNRYKTEVFIVKIEDKFSDDFKTNEKRLPRTLTPNYITNKKNLPKIPDQVIIIDAIFGTGLSKPAEGLFAEIIDHLSTTSAVRVAVDIPSGLFCDKTNEATDVIFSADYTATFQLPKRSFFFAESHNFVGDFEVLDIGLDQDFIENSEADHFFVNEELVKQLIKPRTKFSDKKTYGHALLVAGEYGKIGAAVLSSQACMRSGAGLLTVHVPACGYTILQTTIPEAMVSIDESHDFVTKIPFFEKYNAVGIGPGLGRAEETRQAVRAFFEKCKSPVVIDADAINILAENKSLLELVPAGSILTPHAGEFERLVGNASDDGERLEKAKAFAEKHTVYIILKGAFTRIITPERKVYFNSSGNPGMATAGSGDTLTGVLTALLTQGYSPCDAAVFGVFIHGLAGDIAAKQMGQVSMTATDIIAALPSAFLQVS